jgi:hypothetical protein
MLCTRPTPEPRPVFRVPTYAIYLSVLKKKELVHTYRTVGSSSTAPRSCTSLLLTLNFDSSVIKFWLEISVLNGLETSMEGSRQRPMTSRYVLIIGDDVFYRGDEQGDWSDHLLSHLCRNAKTSYRLKSIHGHISPFSLILVGLDRD